MYDCLLVGDRKKKRTTQSKTKTDIDIEWECREGTRDAAASTDVKLNEATNLSQIKIGTIQWKVKLSPRNRQNSKGVSKMTKIVKLTRI